MTPNQFLDIIMMARFVRGGGSLTHCDCWGHNVQWYKHILNIDISDVRTTHSPNIRGLRAGYNEFKASWTKHDTPDDHDMVLMNVGKIVPGHTGIYYRGHISHMSEDVGYQYVPVDRVESRIHGYYGRR